MTTEVNFLFQQVETVNKISFQKKQLTNWKFMQILRKFAPSLNREITMNITERFLKYVSFTTTSDENTRMTPSTPGQMIFAQYLVEELKSIGLTEVDLDKNGYIMATLPANTDKAIPTIGFIAHMDTSPDMTGKNVKPRIVENYNGEDILLNEDKLIVLETEKYGARVYI